MDEHFRPPAIEIAVHGGLTALAVGAFVLALAASVVWWKNAPWRALFVVADIALALFAVIIGTYQFYDIAELISRFRYNRDRRLLLLERLEAALNADLDGNGVVGRVSELPRIIPVRTAGGVRLVEDDPVLQELEHLIDAAGQVGLSRRRLLPRIGNNRALYDWALGSDDGRQLGVLVAAGLVTGRGARSEGRLAYDPEVCKRILRRAWQSVMSNDDGNGHSSGHGAQPSPDLPGGRQTS